MSNESMGSVTSAASQAETGDAVALLTLKKALEIQTQNALQLVQALPQQTTKSPPNLGNAVNTFA